jgi:hypothetical protein
MLMKFNNCLVPVFILALVILHACKNNKDTVSGIYEHGVVIINEGTYGSGNGSISYYNPSTDSLYNDIFELANNRPLGDVVQSFSVANDKGFIVVNNSQKVEVVLLNTFKSLGVFAASYPRYFIPVSNTKGYLTNGYTPPGEVLVINTNTLLVTDTIIVGNQPEHLLLLGSKVFVANGNWGNDSTISVIDANTDKLLKTVRIGVGASNLVSVDDQSIWVLCQGKTVYNSDYTQVVSETDHRLVKMSTSDYSILYSVIIGNKADGCNPYLMDKDKTGNIYYVEADGVHRVAASSSVYNDNLIIPWDNSSGFSIYGMNVDPVTSNIYLLVPNGFSSAGKFYVYDPTGKSLHSFNVGIAPNEAIRY